MARVPRLGLTSALRSPPFPALCSQLSLLINFPFIRLLLQFLFEIRGTWIPRLFLLQGK